MKNDTVTHLESAILACRPADTVAEVDAMATVEGLLEGIAADIATHGKSREAAVQAVIDGGQKLTKLRRAIQHGAPVPMLNRLGMQPRTAQRWMKLAATGLTAAQVLDCGGVVRALELGDFARLWVQIYRNSGTPPELAEIEGLFVFRGRDFENLPQLFSDLSLVARGLLQLGRGRCILDSGAVYR